MSVITEDATRPFLTYVHPSSLIFMYADHHSHRVSLVTEGSILERGPISAKSQHANERKHWPGSRANLLSNNVKLLPQNDLDQAPTPLSPPGIHDSPALRRCGL